MLFNLICIYLHPKTIERTVGEEELFNLTHLYSHICMHLWSFPSCIFENILLEVDNQIIAEQYGLWKE